MLNYKYSPVKNKIKTGFKYMITPKLENSFKNYGKANQNSEIWIKM